MNSIVIAGRIGKDPERDVVGDGIERIRFSVGVARFVKKGEDPKTDWFNVTAFGKRGAAIAQYCHKGDQIIVRGQMQSYKDKEDKVHWNLLADDFDFGAKSGGGKTAQPSAEPAPAPVEGFSELNEEDIPF